MTKIKKLEDMPKYVPIILIQNQDGKSRIFGNNPHDNLVVNYDKTNLYYYNSQCGDGSLFFKEDASCFDDEFYSSWCEMVDIEKLITEHDKQVRKEICDEIRKTIFEYLKVKSMNELKNLTLLDSTLTYDVITDKLNEIELN